MNPGGFTQRALFCALVVLLTWNPTGLSYVHWVATGAASPAEAVAAGLALLALHLLLARIAFLSLGLGGVALILIVMLFAGLSAREAGWPAAWLASAIVYGPLVALSMVLALGVNWSIIKRRLFGQSNTLNPPP